MACCSAFIEMGRLRESRFSTAVLDPFAVKGMRVCDAKGIAPHAGHAGHAGHAETDSDWQPV